MLVPALLSQPSFILALFISSPSWVKHTDASHYCTAALTRGFWCRDEKHSFLQWVDVGMQAILPSRNSQWWLCTRVPSVLSIWNLQKWKLEFKELSCTYQERKIYVNTAYQKTGGSSRLNCAHVSQQCAILSIIFSNYFKSGLWWICSLLRGYWTWGRIHWVVHVML